MDLNLPTPQAVTRRLGFSRPPLLVEDLPTPEEAFKVRRIGWQELILFVLGPSLIALGISIGSGEWLIGPLNIGQYGFQGVGWVILVSAILQVFYNVELARFTMATGEPPIVAFGRIPPGYLFWVPVALISFYMAFILGGWTVSAGESLFTLVNGRTFRAEELQTVRTLGIALLCSTFLFVLFGRKIERTMEIAMGIFLPYILISLLLVTLVVVPFSYWNEALTSLVRPSPEMFVTDPAKLGALAGFTALASGLNFMFIGYYRDKGYGMGSRMSFLPGLFGAGKDRSTDTTGRIFPESERNTTVWKRWFRYLILDQWGIYFFGALLGMLLPAILGGYLINSSGEAPPDSGAMVVYVAQRLGEVHGPLLFGWALLVGFAVLYTTQIVILELLARNLTDAAFGVSGLVRRITKNDPRRLYYLVMLVLIFVIGFLIHLGKPALLINISANLSNFAALLFPLGLIYLNLQLPRPARARWWSILMLLSNTAFFGYFFINFVRTNWFALLAALR